MPEWGRLSGYSELAGGGSVLVREGGSALFISPEVTRGLGILLHKLTAMLLALLGSPCIDKVPHVSTRKDPFPLPAPLRQQA